MKNREVLQRDVNLNLNATVDIDLSLACAVIKDPVPDHRRMGSNQVNVKGGVQVQVQVRTAISRARRR